MAFDDIDDFLKRYTRQKVRDEAARQGVPPDEVDRIANAESSYRPEVITGARSSPKGAIGTMQLMSGTADELGVDPYNLEDNIKGGVRYYKQQRDRFGSNRLASAAYNAGPGVIEKYGGVPPYTETQDYVEKTDEWKTQPSSTAPIAPKDDIDDFLDRYQAGTTEEQARQNLPPLEKPANRPVTAKPLSATEQRYKRAGQIIHEIEGRKKRAFELFQQADQAKSY